MGTRERRQAVAISPFDVSDSAELLVQGCEDCACAVNSAVAPELPATVHDSATERPDSIMRWIHGKWIRASAAREFPVISGYTGIFNPAGDGGVVVLNDLARQLLGRLGTPVTIEELRASLPLPLEDVT